MSRRAEEGAATPRRRRRRGVALLALVLLPAVAAAFAALGVWQVERRAWKLDLVGRVEARIHAAPAAPPGPGDPDLSNPRAVEYRRLELDGRFFGAPTLVQALTRRGGGYWVLSPFRTAQGFAVLVNRGFVPAGTRPGDVAPAPEAPARLTGLLRLTEPGGGFLRSNDPAAGRWYSRDVAAIAGARGLAAAAPYFVDAQTAPEAAGGAARGVAPVPGLTVVAFPNNHLVYALTWFALSLMALSGAVLLLRRERRPAPPGAGLRPSWR